MGACYHEVAADHIIRRLYMDYFGGKEQMNRPTWDPLRVLYGCRPSARALWDLSPSGDISLDDKVEIHWQAEPNRNRAYAYVQDYAAMRRELEPLMTHDPRQRAASQPAATDRFGSRQTWQASSPVAKLAGMNWKATWIWHPHVTNQDNLYLHFRRSLKLDGPAQQAKLYVSAGSLYQLSINGKFVGRGPNPADAARYYYDVYEVTLQPGENVFAATCFSYGPKPHGVIHQNYGPGGFLLELRDSAGRPMLATDSSWRVTPATEWQQDAPVNCTLYGDFKEYYDARKEPVGWRSPGFDDSSWSEPSLLGTPPAGPYPNLFEREIPFLSGPRLFPANVYNESASVTYAWRDDWEIYHEQSLIPGNPQDPAPKPTEIRAKPKDFSPALLLDFGRLVTGYPEIEIRDSAGGTIDVLYGEDLRLVRVDRFNLRGGHETLQPFNRRTFRYLKLLFADVPRPIFLDRVSVDLNTYPVQYRGAFSCSDPRLTRIWEVGRYTIQMSMLDHFVDCPWRERTIYGGDVYAENLIAAYAFGDQRLNRKTLRQMFAIQFPEGALPPLGPYSGFDSFYSSWTAFFGLAFLDDYQLSGDREFLDELWPAFARLLNWAANEAQRNTPHLVGSPATGGDFAAWSAAPKVRFAAWEAIPFYVLLNRAGQLATELSLPDAARYSASAEQMAQAIREHMITPDLLCQSIPPGKPNQQDAAYLLWSGLLTREEGSGGVDAMLSPTIPPIATPFQGMFLLQGTFDYGRPQEALDYMRRYWGSMLDRGATTFWEHFDERLRPEHAAAGGMSVCHGWSAAPTYALPAYILGVRPLTAGMEKVRIQPLPCDLTWAEGVVPTPLGDISVNWRRSGNEFRLTTEIPAGCTAVVVLPEFCRRVPQVNGKPVSGELILSAGRHKIRCQ